MLLVVSMGIWGPRYVLYHICTAIFFGASPNHYRTGSKSARNRDPEENESTVFYSTFVLLILFYIYIYIDYKLTIKNTLLRVIPTMTFIRFVTGKSSGILSDISSGIRSGKSSGILSGKHSGTLSGIPCGILSGISELILSGILSGILYGISSGILSGILSGVLSGISSGILSDMLSGVLSGISSGILSGRWGPVVLTELGRSQAEVQRCSLSSEGPRLRSSSAHSYRTPAVEVQQCPLHAEVGEELARRTAVEVQQCPLHAEVGEELARRKWTWKWMQRWWRRRGEGGGGEGGGGWGGGGGGGGEQLW